MILGRKISLREFKIDDLERMHSWVNDEKIGKNLSFSVYPRTLNDSKMFLELQLDRKDDSYLNYVITENNDSDNKYIGSVGLKDIDYINRKAELNIAIGFTECMGNGYGTEATKLMVTYGFERLGLNKVYLKFIKFNEAAKKAYEKAGFEFVCEMEEDIYYRGKYYNQVYMEILSSKYFKEQDSDEI